MLLRLVATRERIAECIEAMRLLLLPVPS